jgi:L-lactate utilization protein LutB
MNEIEKQRFRKMMPKTLEVLKAKRFDPHFFETAAEAREFISNQVQPGETVGIGGSVTIREGLGMTEFLRERGAVVCDHWEAKSPQERIEMKRKQGTADVFLCSMNAITSDGILVNMDGGGNRVAGTCSGPKRVIVAAGVNKIVENLDLAIHRTRNDAAVANAIRLERNTPCAETGVCTDCSAPQRICAALLILFKRPSDIDRFTVVLINEELGY